MKMALLANHPDPFCLLNCRWRKVGEALLEVARKIAKPLKSLAPQGEGADSLSLPRQMP
jgi:hypothetical protein